MNDRPRATVHHGDALDVLRGMPDCSVDSVVCDPPYGLSQEPDMVEVLRHWLAGDDYQHKGSGFMGKTWDSFVPGPSVWRECYRVSKPGGHFVAFAGSRTYDLMGVAIRIAGFEIRDGLQWAYGSGFPKSLSVEKAVASLDGSAAERFRGFGTALKPSVEPIVLARRPLEGTVAGNVLAWGTGGINVDACRVDAGSERFGGGARGSSGFVDGYERGAGFVESGKGRWPSNFVLSHASTPDGYDACEDGCVDGCPVREMDEQSGMRPPGRPQNWYMDGYTDEGGASRFFPTFRYQAKAGRAERPVVDGVAHPTVKPLALMSWLCRLVTPPGGRVLDPFAGSGTTGEAALLEGFMPILIEQGAEYLPLIEKRLARVADGTSPLLRDVPRRVEGASAAVSKPAPLSRPAPVRPVQAPQADTLWGDDEDEGESA